MVKEIRLTRGFAAVVEDEDFARFGGLRWTADVRKSGAVYAHRRVDGRKIYLHRAIVGASSDELVDHRDRDTLNCVRSNLRTATRTGNAVNSGKRRGERSSRFKGVTRFAPTSTWTAFITVGGHSRHLGYFMTEEEAARAYDGAAKAAWGDYAYVNFPGEWQENQRVTAAMPQRLARNGRKAHCKMGHPLDAENRYPKTGACRACARERAKRWKVTQRHRKRESGEPFTAAFFTADQLLASVGLA